MIKIRIKDRPYHYKANITDVIDGDTYDAEVDLGFGITNTVTLRLNKYDTPELRAGHELEKKAAKKVTSFVTNKINNRDKKVVIKTIEQDSFGRWLADVWYYDLFESKWKSLGRTLFDKGYARKYRDGKPSWYEINKPDLKMIMG